MVRFIIHGTLHHARERLLPYSPTPPPHIRRTSACSLRPRVLSGVLMGVLLHEHELHRIVAALHAVLLDGRACPMELLLALNQLLCQLLCQHCLLLCVFRPAVRVLVVLVVADTLLLVVLVVAASSILSPAPHLGSNTLPKLLRPSLFSRHKLRSSCLVAVLELFFGRGTFSFPLSPGGSCS